MLFMLFIERLVNTPCFSTTENKRARTLFGAILSTILGPYMRYDKVKYHIVLYLLDVPSYNV